MAGFEICWCPALGARPSLDSSIDTWTIVYPAPDPERGFPGPIRTWSVTFSTGAHANTSGSAPVALPYHWMERAEPAVTA